MFLEYRLLANAMFFLGLSLILCYQLQTFLHREGYLNGLMD
jgi:hypothetical protein